MPAPTCDTCLYWKRFPKGLIQYTHYHGECCINAPTAKGQPVTLANIDFCGQHKAKEPTT